VAGWVVEHGETLIVPAAENDPRVRQSRRAKQQSGKPLPEGASTVRSVIALPLCGRKGTHGAIEIFNPQQEQLNDYTIAFLHILADHAAIAIENARDVARIQQLTITDDTTGLYNVRHLYDRLGRELEGCHQHGIPLSLIFIDLDHFKLVNDEHGHLVGSELLERVGLRLQQLSRKHDWCFRYGGDEFVILMPQTTADEALVQTECLHAALQQTCFKMKCGLELKVSASVGLATAPADGATNYALIGTADSRMYAAKASGRGCICGA
jgi:diguanylate cyclase (GGDEF)-like protein